ncbi:MAG TPA: acetyl-CoA C-acetyltransferase [Gammaproteobacteria bacterium]|nr:acetyl-CoA C-acetyltransferase [Gammaproteobacteria bacterium]
MKTAKKAYQGKSIYIIDGSRTPLLKSKATPDSFSASDLAVAAARNLLLRQNFNIKDIDEVVFGCVMPGPDEVNIGRVIALRLGCDVTTTAYTVQRNCASGMQALDSAAQTISLGRADLVLAGGTESMSLAPVLFSQAMVVWLSAWSRARKFSGKMKALSKFRPAYLTPIIGLLRGLSDPVVGLSMGQTAEKLAHRFDISRQQMDEYALQSHLRLAQAHDENRFDGEIVALYDKNGRHYVTDTGLRRDSSLEQLAKLRPVFDKKFGHVTAGNSAQITDGAACLILASEAAVKKHKLKPIGKIRDTQWAGLDPSQMGLGPVHAMTPIMKRNKLDISDIDYWELNEAFAAQVLACQKAWNDKDYCISGLGLKEPVGLIPMDKLNVDGGGISIGHPVGTSGARIVLHLLRTMQQREGSLGMATLCIGGGQGGAMLIEKLEGEQDDE